VFKSHGLVCTGKAQADKILFSDVDCCLHSGFTDCDLILQFALLENVLTSISDEFPNLRNHKLAFCVSTAFFCFIVGLSCVTYVSNSSRSCLVLNSHLSSWISLLIHLYVIP